MKYIWSFSFILLIASQISGQPFEARAPQPGRNFLDPSTFPSDYIVSGGVPKDGIPALTDPSFVDANSSAASYLSDTDLILGVVINGEAKAYPHNIGWWHEIVNDTVGGQPIIVSFCPLTGTGLVFDGNGSGGSRLTTGVSGLLFNNNLIMYDRRDNETLYPQMTHTGIAGPKRTETLNLLPVTETTWSYWRQLYPNTTVIGNQNLIYSPGRYFSYPYGDYREPDNEALFAIMPDENVNPLLEIGQPKNMVLGVQIEGLAVAYPFPLLGKETVINDEISKTPIVVIYYDDAQLAIPYERKVNNQTLIFEKTTSNDPLYPFYLRDRETGSLWNLKGEAISGSLQGSQLNQIPAHNAFWFAWATFWQNTGITLTDQAPSVTPPSIESSDFNNDGTVDFADFLQFVTAFGKTQSDQSFDPTFDLNADGSINFPDFLQFASVFGQKR